MKDELLKSGIRVLYLFDRNTTYKDRKHFKLISRGVEHFDEVFNRLLKTKAFEEKRNPDGDYRVYSSVNSRNIKKAIKQFKIVQLENDFTDDIDLHNSFYLDIWNRWISILARDENRDTKYFLFDCDSEEEKEFTLNFLEGKDLIVYGYPTRKGYHVITKPFDFNEMNRKEGYKDYLFKDGLIATEFALTVC